MQLKTLLPLHPLVIAEMRALTDGLTSKRLQYSFFVHSANGRAHSFAGWKLVKDAGKIKLEYEMLDVKGNFCSDASRAVESRLTYNSKRKLERKLFVEKPYDNWNELTYAKTAWGLTCKETQLLLRSGLDLEAIVATFEQLEQGGRLV